MSIDHRGLDILVAEKLLDRSDVIPIFKQVSGKGVAEGVATGSLDKSGTGYRFLYCTLNDGSVHMVSSLLVRLWIPSSAILREDPLPPRQSAAALGYFFAKA